MRGFRKAVWLVDTAGRVVTVIVLVGFAVAVGSVTAGVLRAVSHLPATWLALLSGGLAVIVFVVGFVLVMQVLAEGLHLSQQADSCWVVQEPAIDTTVLTAAVLIANADPAQLLRSVSIKIDKVNVDGKRRPGEMQGRIMKPPSALTDIRPGRSEHRIVHFMIKPKLEPAPNVVRARVGVRDQFNRRHRGKIEFLAPPTSPTTPTTPNV